jgi:hypothetical protein
MNSDEFEHFGSRDYDHIVKPWETPEPKDYTKDIENLKQDVAQLKSALKSLMDMLSTKNEQHPLYWK